MTDKFIARLQEGLQLENLREEEFEPARGVSLKFHSPGTGNL